MNFSVAISHTPWIPERVESFKRLCEGLELVPTQVAGQTLIQITDKCHVVSVFQDREPNWSWSEKMWRWAAATSATHCLFLQDDVIPMPGFWNALQAMVEANPDAVIGLETAHPTAPALRDENQRWMTTADGLIGVAYVVPREFLKAFLNWRATALEPHAVENISEDSLLGLYAAYVDTRIWHPIPTIIDHDISIPSTYQNEHHPNRRPSVKWADTASMATWDAYTWKPASSTPHLGLYYTATPGLIEKWVAPSPRRAAALTRLKKDTGQAESRRIWYAKRGRMPIDAAQKRLFVAIPNRGAIHPETAATVWRLRGEEFLTEWDVVDVRQEAADICRIRARLVYHFLYNTDATHLLFLDSDVACHTDAIRGMLGADRDFVATPYPRRDCIDFTMVQKLVGSGEPAEAAAYRYSARLPLELNPDEAGCAEAYAMPLGCALISRGLLERMVAVYKAETFQDEILPGQTRPTVGLFNLVIDPLTKGLLSEDYSFCHRVGLMKEKVWLYLGHGSPASHYGTWGYHGVLESFGFRREKL